MSEQFLLGPEPALFPANFTGNAQRGYIVSTQQAANLPFAIQRVFWSFGVPGNLVKGNHAHREDQKVLVALHGSITIETETNTNSIFLLQSPFQALYIPTLCWIKLYYNPESILLALSSTDYNEQDYIFDYQEFKQLRQQVPE